MPKPRRSFPFVPESLSRLELRFERGPIEWTARFLTAIGFVLLVALLRRAPNSCLNQDAFFAYTASHI